MNYSRTVNYLYSLQKQGIKFGLDNTVRLLALLGNPQDSFKTVHIAGTNGKGSTSAMVASIVKTAGFRAGLFTSPHMVSFTERIRVNSVEIEEGEVVKLTAEIREAMAGSKEQRAWSQEMNSGLGTQDSTLNPTFFEFVTALGLLYFKKKGVEWAVVETGMGGRLDATNALLPLVTVITNVGLDHGEFLGRTLGEVAGEKAGIIKRGVPVVISSQEDEALRVIEKKAKDMGSTLSVYGRDFISRPKKIDTQGIIFDYEGKDKQEGLYVPLPGLHQLENASVALRAVETLMEGEPIPFAALREGLANTKWPGRLELIKSERCSYDFLIDGAHNPAASRALADSLKRVFLPGYERMILILGIMADKDVGGIMNPLLPLAFEAIFTSPGYERAASPHRLSEYAAGMGFKSSVTGSVKEAMRQAREMAGNYPGKTLIVITGSFYTIGEAKTHLGEKCHAPSLSGLR